ncbi:MAG: hypothetical protein HKN23_18165 [Verrucomicrobiales bacterium]|nr:hypothetical protein [Verrucomicrobiales bacterium]
MKRTIRIFLLAAVLGGGSLISAQDKSGGDEAAKKKPEGPEKWEKDMQKFVGRDKATPPPENAVLFVGSSSIRMWKVDEAWPDLDTINNGFGGSQISDAIHHFDRCIAPYKNLKAIVIYAGDNDVNKGKDAARVFADFQELWAKIKKTHPGVPTIFIAIKPSTKRWDQRDIQHAANMKIAALAEKQDDLYYADIAKPMLNAAEETGQAPPADLFKDDGLHMSEKGYEMWHGVIDAELKKAGVGK